MEHYWSSLASRYHLNASAIFQLQDYAKMLQVAATQCNLTTIVQEHDIIAYHFADSLELGNLVDMSQVSTLIDVGSGAGFPGLPLKIAYPHCALVLLEVIAKRCMFLHNVVANLQLTDVCIDERDWRTFLRTSQQHAHVVCARASLKPSELLRMFQPSSPLKSAQLIYWASEQWQPTAQEHYYMRNIHVYKVGDRVRKLVTFGEPSRQGI